MTARSIGLAMALVVGISVSSRSDEWMDAQRGAACNTCGGSIASGLHAHGRHIKRTWNEYVAGRQLIYLYDSPDKNGYIRNPVAVLTGPAFEPVYKTPKNYNPGYPINQSMGGTVIGQPMGGMGSSQYLGGTVVPDSLPSALTLPAQTTNP